MVDKIAKETNDAFRAIRKGTGDIDTLVRKLLKNSTSLSDDVFWEICDKLAQEFICGRRGAMIVTGILLTPYRY